MTFRQPDGPFRDSRIECRLRDSRHPIAFVIPSPEQHRSLEGCLVLVRGELITHKREVARGKMQHCKQGFGWLDFDPLPELGHPPRRFDPYRRRPVRACRAAVVLAFSDVRMIGSLTREAATKFAVLLSSPAEAVSIALLGGVGHRAL